MKKESLDSGFEKFRRERQRNRPAPKVEEPGHVLDKQQLARRQLEQADAAEVQDERLTREVKDFFEAATRTAADIVKKIAELQEAATTERISEEMQEFLVDAIARMESFVDHLDDSELTEEKNLEPHMHNLVGPMLDSFRLEGTAQVGDQHLGQDPFATGVEEAVHGHEPRTEPKAPERAPLPWEVDEAEGEPLKIEKVESLPIKTRTEHPLRDHGLDPETVLDAGPEAPEPPAEAPAPKPRRRARKPRKASKPEQNPFGDDKF